MIDKYEPICPVIYEYINSRLTASATIDMVAQEIAHKFPMHIIFSDVKKTMQIELAEQLVKAISFTRQLYRDVITKQQEEQAASTSNDNTNKGD